MDDHGMCLLGGGDDARTCSMFSLERDDAVAALAASSSNLAQRASGIDSLPR